MVFRANVYTQRAIARLAKAEKKIIKQGYTSTQDLVTVGKEFARATVPKGKTGWLYNSIKGRTTVNNAGPKGEIYLSPVILPNDGVHRKKYTGQNWKYVRFNLARWMHTSPRAKSHFRSGDAQFMYSTRDYLKGAGVKRVRKDFEKLRF
jgi:hypothetical protein